MDCVLWAMEYGPRHMEYVPKGSVFCNMGDGLWIAGKIREPRAVGREARPDSRLHWAESRDPSAERREPKAETP